MDQLELDAELDRIGARARQRYRARLPWAIGAGVLVVAAVLVVGHFLPDHEHHAGPVRQTVMFVVTMLFLAAMVAGLVQQRRAGQPLWPRPSLVLGLDRPRRKQVMADVRHGRPSGDAVLRAVEQREVVRLRSFLKINRWQGPVLFVFLALQGVDELERGGSFGVVGLFAAVLVLVALLYSVRYYRGVRAFP